ncbi:hypothetical protein V6M85_09905 [Sulfolobus tengchongensis]|uniref:Uncharacterized protein n=1 Tax=Sulfolobus tengchongensis TaxID=207809 RepID=A0AAX4L0Q6_9CREN
MVEVLSSKKDVEVFLSKNKDKCKIGDIIDIVISESVLEDIPTIVSKYGFSMIDGENIGEDVIKVRLEFRQIFR